MGDKVSESPFLAAALLRRYVVWLAGYFAAMGVLWVVGVEGVYGHPTPFYAVWLPATKDLPGTLLYHAAAFLVGGLLMRYLALRLAPVLAWSGADAPRLPAGSARRYLLALILFSIAFPCLIAMQRGGLHGISQAYERSAYEFIGDIGKGGSISGLFGKYLELHPYLSMHAKVHPPGPIAYLWLLSLLVFTQDPLVLSLATVVVGALALIPLFYWTRELLGEPAALVAAAVYACVPSVVLFNATSGDALFPIVTLSCLYFFDRALHSPTPLHGVLHAALAGVGYFLMTILKFSLVAMGAYFALAGLLVLARPGLRRNVFLTAGVMLGAFIACHALLHWGTGFDMVGTFQAAKTQFDMDQHHLDLETPRLPSWVYRFLNPMCWFYFAGIPVSLLFLGRLRRPEAETRGLFLVFLLMALLLNVLYLARGEGERSALYLFPFLVLPAAHLLLDLCRRAQSLGPLQATLGFLIFQTWLTEFLFYTYW